MKVKRTISVIDSHTAGHPTRIVTMGVPPIHGATMAKKRDFFREKLDSLRIFLMQEPRGHKEMFGAILTPPSDKHTDQADLGAIFIDCTGYLDMCGHGTIGLVTVVLETDLLARTETVTNVVIDTPAGLIYTRAEMDEELRVKNVTLRNVPSFLYKKNVSLDSKILGDSVSVDISFGGNFNAIVDSKEIDIAIRPGNGRVLLELGMELLQLVNKEEPVTHPEMPFINHISHVQFSEPPSNPGENYKNMVVFGQYQTDRSPCGTGTSARMAALHDKGKLNLNESFIHENGITGTTYKGLLIENTKVGKFKAVIPEVTASAFITGFNQLVLDDRDPIGDGFFIGF